MPDESLLLMVLASATGLGSAMLLANLVTGQQNRLRRRHDLAIDAQRLREAYTRRVRAELEAFEAEFEDIDIVFDS